MKISTEIGSATRIVGEKKAVELCAKAGFDAWDLSMFRIFDFDWNTRQATPKDHPLCSDGYLRFVRELRHIGEDNGIYCNQSHAPFPVSCSTIRDFAYRAIECSAEAGAEICVIHPDNCKTPEKNAEFFQELLPFAKAHGVKIATENMWNWDPGQEYSSFAACSTSEDFCRHIDVVNDPFLVACLDIGHAEMKGSGSGAVNMIRALGHRLQALHLHDNDLHHDCHQIPFAGSIDFGAVVCALKEIGYDGVFTLEADSHLKAFDQFSILVGMHQLADSARRLAAQFESV